MKFDLHIVQMDRETCEVPGHKHLGTDWDHCIFKQNNKKSHPEFAKFVNNHFNMLRACAESNRWTKETDKWPAKKWLIDYHMDGEYRYDFLDWIDTWPDKLHPTDEYVIDTYITRRRKE